MEMLDPGQPKLTLAQAKVALLVLAEHSGLVDLILRELPLDTVELHLLRSHPLYATLSDKLLANSALTPDEILARAEQRTVNRLVSIVDKGDDGSALKAAKEILDRVKGKPVQTNRTISVNISADMSVDAIRREREEAEQRLAALRAKRESMKTLLKSNDVIELEPGATQKSSSQPAGATQKSWPLEPEAVQL